MLSLLSMDYITPKGWSKDTPYSPAVKVGNMIFVAGQTGTDEQGRTVGNGDARAQARQIFTKIKTILKAAGAGLEDVTQLTVFFTDMRDIDAVREVRKEFFKSHKPASASIGITSLAKPEYKLEVQAIAVKEDKPKRRAK
ncbi:MAG: RidA family protein [Thaumarchaeota archaeon]|nr:RidA family protein [Nitrososphaerota archaeon]